MQIKVQSLSGESKGDLNLNPEHFSVPLRKEILARVVRWQLAKRRSGNHATKGISLVSGTTKKPHKQKGTGRARQGSLRSPQFRGGGIIFGPVVRSHAHGLQKKVRKLGLQMALSQCFSESRVSVVDCFSSQEGKTRELKPFLKDFSGKRVLFVGVDSFKKEQLFFRSVKNNPGVDVLSVAGLNVYDILRHHFLVLERDVFSVLEKRWSDA